MTVFEQSADIIETGATYDGGMKFLATLLLIAGFAMAQESSVQSPSLSDEVQDLSLEAKTFIEALLKISARFQFPLAVEWTKSADTLKPVRLSWSRTTVGDIIQTVVSTYAGYQWRTEDGVIHVFQQTLEADSRNPLNITIKSFDEEPETLNWANNNLGQMVSHVVRHPELSGMTGSVLGGRGEPVCRFAAKNAPVRGILNTIVKCGTPTLLPASSKLVPLSWRMKRIWIATFPEEPTFSRTGFLEVVPMWNPKFVSDDSQPFWVLLPWGDPPPAKAVR